MYFTSEDMTLYYEKYGNHKRNIILLPGWGETRSTFSYMIQFLQNYFTVYIVDYPGIGNSPFPSHDLTIYDYARCIYDWIRTVEIDHPILIGHSFGGRIITVLLGYYHYSFSDIILIDSAGIKPKKSISSKLKTFTYKFLKKMVSFFPLKYRKKCHNYLFSKFASPDYHNLNPCMRKTFQNIVNEDLKPYLKHIQARTLLIWGNNDMDTPVSDAYIMKKFIPKSELIVLEGLTHFSYLENPNLINQIIYEQLKDEISL